MNHHSFLRVSSAPALIFEEKSISYQNLCELIEMECDRIKLFSKVPQPIALEVTHDLDSYVRFLALLSLGFPVFLCPSYQWSKPEFRDFLRDETQTDFYFLGRKQGWSEIEAPKLSRVHESLKNCIKEEKSSFIVRTSGSSGKKYKFVHHLLSPFLEKYVQVGKTYERMLAFSPFESIAGIETLLETLSTGSALVAAGDRLAPHQVGDILARKQIDYFATTPTFLTLMLLSKCFDSSRMGHLTEIAFGSEPSQLKPLRKIQDILPKVRLRQTYGMTEIGILRTLIHETDPSFFRLDSNFNPGRVVDGILEIQTPARALCYLNTEMSPGSWFSTGDCVESESGGLRVLGRDSDLMNVAGRKFFPSEIEEYILKNSQVMDATVVQQKNDLIGQAIVARLVLKDGVDELVFRSQFQKFCEEVIPFFMRPHRIHIDKEARVTDRFKRDRTT